MNKRRPFHILLQSMALTLLVGLAMPGLADDTDIYWQQIEQQQITQIDDSTRPNILFVLDNSGSMMNVIRNENDGQPLDQRRIDVLKEALLQMLGNAELNNINVGLARFASLIEEPKPPVNAPIMFPVKFIDAQTKDIPGEENDSIVEVVTSIVKPEDDAEENVYTGEMRLTDKTLEMVSVISEEEPDGIRVDKQIAQQKDDAVEWDHGNYAFRSLDTIHYLGYDFKKHNNIANDRGDSLVGLRFQELGIPKNAMIVQAELELQCPYESDLDEGINLDKACGNAPLNDNGNNDEDAEALDFNINVYGAALDGKPDEDAAGVPFGDKDYQNPPGGGGSSEKYFTRNFMESSLIMDDEENPMTIPVKLPPLVNEETKEVQEGRTFKVPNLAPIVQAIVNREGWHYNNSMVLLLERQRSIEDTTPLLQTRAFYAYDGSGEAPKLRVYWKMEGEIEKNYVSGWNDNVESDAEPKDKLQVTHHQMVKKDTDDVLIPGQDIRLGHTVQSEPGTETQVGLLFPEIDIPTGAKITEAKLILTQQGERKKNTKTANRNNLLTLEVCAEKVANAETFRKDEPNRSVRNRFLLRRTDQCGEFEWTDILDATSENPNQREIEKDIIQPILEELMAQPDWEMGNNIVFLFQRKEGTSTESYRRIVAAGDLASTKQGYKVRRVDSDNGVPDSGTYTIKEEQEEFVNQFYDFLPRLSIKFTAGLPEKETEEEKQQKEQKKQQYVGLRFENVAIPQGATIVSANIEFTSSTSASISTDLEIKIENTAQALPFTEVAGNISERYENTTTEKVSWGSVTSWKEGVTYTTPDLSGLLQDIVNKSEWCEDRTNPAFIISTGGGANPLRYAKSYDDRPAFAPRLKVRFDSTQISGNKECYWQSWTGRVSSSTDDAEERLDDNFVFIGSPILELGQRSSKGDDPRLVGFRFKSVPISQGAKIAKAHLIFTSRNEGKDRTGNLLIYGEKSPDASTFMREQRDVSKRPDTTKQSFSFEENWEKDKRYQSPDITEVIEEIVQQPDWKTYNDLVLFIEAGSARYDVASFDAGPSAAPVLSIQVKGMLGEDGEGSLMTVRRRLIRMVENIEIPYSSTPIVDALYESSRYFLSGAEGYNKPPYEVDLGKKRHDKREYLVSHPGSYQDGTGTVEGIEKGCNVNLEPFNEACAGEYIDGNAIYESPIETICQTNHLVLLTDGIATRNTVVESGDIQDLIGDLGGSSICAKTYTDPTIESDDEIRVSPNETCGIELTDALFETGNSQKPTITVHTIGFQLGKGWQSIYRLGNRIVYRKDGKYYYQDNDDQLNDDELGELSGTNPQYEENPKTTQKNQEAVKYLCRLASRKEGAGSAPTCPDRNFYLANTVEDLVTVFQKITTAALEETVSSSKVTKMFASPGISISRFNSMEHDDTVYYALFESDNKPVWDGNLKKYRIADGKLIDYNEKEATDEEGQIKGCTEENNGQKNCKDAAQSFWSDSKDGDVVTEGGAGEKVLKGQRTILTYLDETPPALRVPIALTEDYEIQTLSEGEHSLKLAKMLLEDDDENSQIENELTEEQQAQFEELIDWIYRGNRNKWPFGDPLHSSPKVMVYGGSSEEPKSLVFLGTNDGLMRAIDANTGYEKWAFLPKEKLPLQKSLEENNTPTDDNKKRFYGLDATPTFWSYLGADKVRVDPDYGDFVKMFFGMRRGGRNIYALNVTEMEIPKLMWVIKGGKGDFTQLGQTWSSPTPTQVDPIYCEGVRSGTACVVLMFGGGYDEEQDRGINKDSIMGNAIYMVHANSGKLLWWASNRQSDADLRLEGMNYPIPADLTLADYDKDGYTDRIYAADVGGQVWRVDLDPNDTYGGQGGILFKASGMNTSIGDTETSADRTFFYAPAVAPLKGSEKTIIAIVSGTRPHPLYDGSQARDQFYAFVDPVDGPGGNWDDLKMLTPSLLEDVTDLSDSENVNIKNNDQKGWYLNLCEDLGECGPDSQWVGEKGFSPAYVVGDIVYFTTYMIPEPPKTIQKSDDNACGDIQLETTVDFGYSRLYQLNLLTGGLPPGVKVEPTDDNKEGRITDEQKGGTSTSDSKYNKENIYTMFGFTIIDISPREFERIFWTQVDE
jgi:type IV pilus assembly protein PilY1